MAAGDGEDDGRGGRRRRKARHGAVQQGRPRALRRSRTGRYGRWQWKAGHGRRRAEGDDAGKKRRRRSWPRWGEEREPTMAGGEAGSGRRGLESSGPTAASGGACCEMKKERWAWAGFGLLSRSLKNFYFHLKINLAINFRKRR